MDLDFNSKTPIYLQIAEMIRQSILSGDLKEGETIPSVRHVSVEYGLNPQTILNATQLLIRESILEKKRGLGLFVRENAMQRLLDSESEKFREIHVVEFIEQGKLLGFNLKQLCDLIKEKCEERT